MEISVAANVVVDLFGSNIYNPLARVEYTVYVSMTVPLRVAVMVALPSSMPVTTPLLSTVATAGLLEVQTMAEDAVRGLSGGSPL